MTNQSEMINLIIDDRAVSVPKGTTVYHAAKELGIPLPIFCYQDRMPPFGACRVCLVEIDKMGKLQTSCTLAATEGMIVRTQSQLAKDGRKGILEFLLINHPLDCPICDKGGECPLQDQAIEYGPGQSRFFEEKRHFTKAHPLGPVLMLDRERCISCARCTRFGDEIAGDHALEFIDRGYRTEVGTPDGGPAKSKFIGNTIEICPVGALTSQVYRFRARPWDNHATESTCTLCPVGCSINLDQRDGEIVRTRSCENRDLNDIWLCDKGWFGYEFITNAERLQKPLIRKNGVLVVASWDEALGLIAEKFKGAKAGGKLAGLGGNPLTVEENFLFQQLIRTCGGVNHVDHRIGTPSFTLSEEGLPPGMEMTIGECEKLSYALILGSDLTEEFPVIWLRLKQGINRGAHVSFIGHYAPEIAQHLDTTVVHKPGQELEVIQKLEIQVAALAKRGGAGALFVGRQYLNSPRRVEILKALVKIRQSHPNLSLNLLEGNGNSMGARFAGMRPDIAPLGQKVGSPGLSTLEVLETAASKGWDFALVAGADIASKYPEELWQSARKGLGFLVVQDLFLTKTAQDADVVLPTLSFVEKEGSFINIEGRVQRLKPGKAISERIYSDGEIFRLIAARLGVALQDNPQFNDALKGTHISTDRTYTFTEIVPSNNSEISGLAATFASALFDGGVRMRHNPHVSKLAREPRLRLHPSDANSRKLNEGDCALIKSSEGTVTAKVELDESVAIGTAVIPLGFAELPAHNLGKKLFNGMGLEVSWTQH